MTRFVTAVREAWWAFLLTYRGWRINSYDLPVHRDYGRSVGSITRRGPCYPGWRDRRGWGLSSEGITWGDRVWTNPVDAATADSPGRRRMARRLALVRDESTWRSVDKDGER